MDQKESSSDVVYPNVMFCVDNFEEAFSDLYSTVAGEKVAVQLIATNKVCVTYIIYHIATYLFRNYRVIVFLIKEGICEAAGFPRSY